MLCNYTFIRMQVHAMCTPVNTCYHNVVCTTAYTPSILFMYMQRRCLYTHCSSIAHCASALLLTQPQPLLLLLLLLIISLIHCSGCKIAIRGRGSVKEGARRGKTPDEEDDLHVYISGETEEQVEIAAKEVCTITLLYIYI
jgi:hypothetical protein